MLLGLVSAALGFFSLLTSEPVGGLFAVAAVVCGVMVFVVQWRRTGWDG
ncbi:ABC-type Mn2+/Zn2+ transport system permease subunit [Catenuloplanes nepalensis]|uniref:ABC-type Mn2+/Zn2+ transport system permease subunit n=1 Tax=Catenuloplanes nepalensis TaxID=587533 RepID=A0ABT9N192_9ACTN|nr:hypothetical protein [Catenuloplanes nepalensis]MDP9797462.1 ABC-type Mn2+/Zn2+ transport system permease subunit [Catenuloplanes nepalensis]